MGKTFFGFLAGANFGLAWAVQIPPHIVMPNKLLDAIVSAALIVLCLLYARVVKA